ncbi:hypothetical protein ACGFNU_18250 [Spirillospora sp. NPDC048911]|uniref:hypothetical protein n=1 Tax=Spirillospora sp. NPDC048911 TaxID=3364527 RepID=UPI00371FACED
MAPPFRPGPPPEPTGDPRVDAALAPLGGLGGTQVADHVEIFEDVHQRLQELLVSADEEEAGPSGPPVPRPPGPGVVPSAQGGTPPGQGGARPGYGSGGPPRQGGGMPPGGYGR